MNIKLLSLTALLALGACDQLKQGDVALETQEQKISYLLGMDNGKNIQRMAIEIDTAAFQQGFTDGLLMTKPQSDRRADRRDVLSAFETEMTAKRDEMQKAEQQATAMQADGNHYEERVFSRQWRQRGRDYDRSLVCSTKY